MMLDAFQKLVDLFVRLIAPNGCPWDREQTMLSMRSSPVEEALELKEAIELGDNAHMCEELGDLFANAVMLGLLAEKEKRFSMQDALENISEKLIRRHPHVFGQVEISDSLQVKEQWEQIKQAEKSKAARTSLLDSIPSGLHVINRAQKVLKKMKTLDSAVVSKFTGQDIASEEELGERIFDLLEQAERKGFDFEMALRKKLQNIEYQFRQNEKI